MAYIHPWSTRAACVGKLDTMFPAHEDGGEAGDAAKALCAECTVREKCLAYALSDVSLVGIWGGMTTRERVYLYAADGRLVPGRSREANRRKQLTNA